MYNDLENYKLKHIPKVGRKHLLTRCPPRLPTTGENTEQHDAQTGLQPTSKEQFEFGSFLNQGENSS